MGETSSSETISTKLQRIAERTKASPTMAWTTLAHHIDIEWLRAAYRRTRKDGATGVDGVTAGEYESRLDDNLRSLLDRAKSGTYRAPPVRRVRIPKGKGETRALGIPTFEDKVLQRAVTMLLNAVYEQEFYDFSHGFRPGRSAHGALKAVQGGLVKMAGAWVLDVDIRRFFDTVDHGHLMAILKRRVRDGVLLRLIGKWLNAGVLDGVELFYPEEGTPQGGVISPILANIFLHTVLDDWFEREVRPRLRGRSFMVRYADDVLVVVQYEHEAHRVLRVLAKRLAKHGLALHPDKTRLVDFRRPDRLPARGGGPRRPTFDLLGFRHYWGVSRHGKHVVMKKTASDRFSRALRRIREWCRTHRHDPVRVQHQALSRKLRGHDAYYGVTGNGRALERFRFEVACVWKKWLNRRSHRARIYWGTMGKLLERLPLPPARIVHRYT